MNEEKDRGVRCKFCAEPMYYFGDVGHRPELRVEAYEHTDRTFEQFYVHKECWNSRVSASPAAPVVDNLQRRLYEECIAANWDPEKRNTFAEEIAHLHEELSEAFRAWRRYKDCEIREVNGKLEGVPIEFADALIGMFYNAELHGFDLLTAIELKHQFNLTRNYVAEGRQLHVASAAPASMQEDAPLGVLRLYDRADGVKDHYCVGRKVTSGGFDYNEFWNKDKFCSAGEVFIGKEAAEAKLKELAFAAASTASTQEAAEKAQQAATDAAREWLTLTGRGLSEHEFEQGVSQLAGIISRYFPEPADQEANPLLPIVAKAAKEPCRNYADGCPANQPAESYWCAPCAARWSTDAIIGGCYSPVSEP